MKIVLQRVTRAKVTIDGNVKGEIGKGYVVLLGIGKDDTEDAVDFMIKKIEKLRLFEDDEGKTNLSLKQVDGQLLVISQFTLYANCKKGTRPSFTDAASPETAESLYNFFLRCCKEEFGEVEHGEFGADMQVELVNDGPFTVILESN